MMRRAVVAGIAILLMPAAAWAQQAPQPIAQQAGTWYYGVATGLGQRTFTGSFLSSQEPAGAGQPPSPKTVVPVTLEGGIGVGPRLALLVSDDAGAAFGNAQGWGTLAFHAALRGWVTDRVWIEGGAGPMDLVYKGSTSSVAATTYWWAPAIEVAGGYELFHGPTVSIHVFVRYLEGSFDGVRERALFFQAGLLGRH